MPPKVIQIDEVKNQDEKEILLFLHKKGRCLYGNIFKDLNLSVSKGSELMLSLISKGYVKHVDKTSLIELNIELKQ